MGPWSLPQLPPFLRSIAAASSSQGRSQAAAQSPSSGGCSWNPGPVLALGLGVGVGLSVIPVVYQHQQQKQQSPPRGLLQGSDLPFASITAGIAVAEEAQAKGDVAVEPKTGLEFPLSLPSENPKASLSLAGLGVRSKNLFGLKKLKIYAYGVFADASALNAKLGSKYSSLPPSTVLGSKWLLEDVIASDCPITVRLVIFYKGLKIGQVRNAFNESLGGKLRELSGKPETDLLHSFTKWFTDDIALQRGTVIDLKRGPGHTVVAEIDGKAQGSLKSALLSRALLSLYIGDNPFDTAARDKVKESFAAYVQEAEGAKQPSKK